MRLSKITETKKGRMALFGEADEFLFSVDAETYYKYGLREGCELDAAALAGLQAASETRRAKDKALGCLALRSYGSQELYEKLCMKFDTPLQRRRCCGDAAPWPFDDAAFARARARHLAGQNKSAREIERRLACWALAQRIFPRQWRRYCRRARRPALQWWKKHYRAKLAAGQREKVLAALARRGVFLW